MGANDGKDLLMGPQNEEKGKSKEVCFQQARREV